MYLFEDLIYRTIDFYSFLILISVIGSWIEPLRMSKVYGVVRKVTNPYLKWFRIIMPLGSMNLDISPVIGIFLLNLLKQVIFRFFRLI